MTDFSDDEAFAAEYALGTLDEAERDAAERRRLAEPAFAALIEAWEARLAPLVEAIPSVAPGADLFPEVIRRLPPATGLSEGGNVIVLRRQIRTWRGVAAVASALAAVLAIWVVGHDMLPTAGSTQTYVAVLQQGAGAPSIVVSLDLATRRMAVMPLATQAPDGKSFELWMIGADKAAPRSMGVIEAKAPMHPALPDMDRAAIAGATYAVTLEPLGGSPTGQPTSAPLYVGKLASMPL